jgi:hypothetical protein
MYYEWKDKTSLVKSSKNDLLSDKLKFTHLKNTRLPSNSHGL